MANATIDIVEGQLTCSEAGIETSRTANVGNIEAPPYAVLKKAIEETGWFKGMQHPAFDDVFCTTVTATPISAKAAKVVASFARRVYEETVTSIETSTTTQQAETNMDNDGNLIVVYYLPSFADATAAKNQWPSKTSGEAFETWLSASDWMPQTGTVAKEIIDTVMVIKRTETRDPSNVAQQLASTVNRRRWNIKRADAPGTWLCVSINSTTNDGGETYDVTYTFRYREEGWTQTAAYQDADGRVPPDADTGVNKGRAIKDVDVQGEEDFNELRFRIAP